MVNKCCSEVKSVRFLESTGMQKVCSDCDKISIVSAVIYGPTQTQDVTIELKEYNVQIGCPLDCFYVDTGALNAYPGGDIEFGYRKAIQIEYMNETNKCEDKCQDKCEDKCQDKCEDKCQDKCEDKKDNNNKTTATSTIGDVIVNVKLNSAYDNDNDYKHESSSRYRQDNSYRGNRTDNTNNSNQGNRTDNTNNSNQGNTDNTNNSNQGNDNSNNSNQGNTDNSNQGNTNNTNNNNNSNQGNTVRPRHRCGICNRRFKRCICQCLEVNPIINCEKCDNHKPCNVNKSNRLYIPLYPIARPYLCPNSKKCQ